MILADHPGGLNVVSCGLIVDGEACGCENLDPFLVDWIRDQYSQVLINVPKWSLTGVGLIPVSASSRAPGPRLSRGPRREREEASSRSQSQQILEPLVRDALPWTRSSLAVSLPPPRRAVRLEVFRCSDWREA